MTPFVIKVCGVKSQDDVRSASDAGATAIGFNFYSQSPRFVMLSEARRASESVPRSVTKVGVFVSPTTEELFRSIEAGELDVIQIHGSLPADVPSGIRIWRAVPVAQKLQLAFDAQAEAYLLDTPTALHGGSGQTFEWSLASTESSARLILAGGLEAANVGAAIRIAHPWGVDACSRLESAPGVKDPQKVKAFVEAARAAFLEFSPIAQSAFVKETV